MKGFGTVVTGTLVSGRIGQDEDLVLLPGGRDVKVRGMQVHGERQAFASAGQRVAVNLGGVEVVGDRARGDARASPARSSRRRVVDARGRGRRGVRPLKHGARVRVHQGTSEVLGRVVASWVRRRPRFGTRRIAPTCGCGSSRPRSLTRGDRFILRAYSPPQTIGGGSCSIRSRRCGPGSGRADGGARFARLDPAPSRRR